VLQDTWLFGGTIRDNIAYGDPEASEEQLHAAAEAAFVDRFVRALPDGYDTLLDDELGRVRVAIRSATALSAVERNELIELARRLTDRQEILAATELDSELIGGVVLDIGGTVYDGSLRTQLARLTREMAEGGG